MSAANVMISKLGGLTTFEAFACRLPIIADVTTEPMPQEAGAAKLLAKRGAGVLVATRQRHCSGRSPDGRRHGPLLGDESGDYWFGDSECHAAHR